MNKALLDTDILSEAAKGIDQIVTRNATAYRQVYAEARVPEYWIVNPRTESIIVLSLRKSAYEEAGTYRRGNAATSALRPEFSVAVSKVFDSVRVH